MRVSKRFRSTVLLLGVALPIGVVAGLLLKSRDPFGRPDRSSWSMPVDVVEAIRSAEAIELLSLDPAKEVVDQDAFHNWKVFGKVRLDSASDRQAVADSLIRDGTGGPGFMCFAPRHGVRLTGPAGTVDLVICFECGQVEVYKNGAKRGYLTDSSGRPLLNQLLTAAGVTLARDPASGTPKR